MSSPELQNSARRAGLPRAVVTWCVALAWAAAWFASAATPARAHTGTVLARLETASPPRPGEPVAVTVLLADNFQFPQIGAAVEARAEGPDRVGRTRLLERSEGVYVGAITFPAGGDWQILLDVEFADGERARATLPLRVAAPGESPRRQESSPVALQPFSPAPWGRIGVQAAVSAAVLGATVALVEWVRRRRGG